MEINLSIDTSTVTLPLSLGVSNTSVAMEVSPPFMPVYPDAYAGPYTVTPRFVSQTLETEHKSMTDDVTVLEIPVHRVSNEAGGVTVSIGG